MKGKKLAAKIMLGLLLATPYGIGEAASALKDYDISKNYTNNEELVLEYSYDKTMSSATILQTRLNSRVKQDVIANYTGRIISLTADNLNSTKNKQISALYTYSGSADNKAITYLGGDATEKISIDVNGHDLVAGIYAAGKEGQQGPQVIVTTKDLLINTNSSDYYSYGIYVGNNTTELNGKEAAKVVINAENTVINSTADVKVDETDKDNHAIAISALSQGQIEINGNLEVNADTVLSTRGGAITKINANNSSDKIVQLNGDINFNYSNTTDVDADVTINLANSDSFLNGNIYVSGVNIPEDFDNVEGMNLGLANGAQWSSDADSFVNNLTVNGGIINLNGEKQNVTIDNLTGNGGTVNVASEENKLSITNSKGENTALTVAASGNYAEQLVQNNVNESLQNLANQVVDNTATGAGKSAATDLYVAETAVAGAITAEVGEDGNLLANTVKEGVNTTNEAISNMANIALMAWRAENNDMNKRLGELRDSKGEHGIWARMVRGEGTYESIKNQYNTYQLGYDEKLSTNPNWTVGAALSYTEGESSFNGGSGENKHTGFAVYGSYLNDDGSFIDLIAKYARLDHDFDVNGGAGSGDYDTNGYSVSAEYGKRFTQDNGMWIEPQVELTYGKIGSANYTTDNGVSVRQDGMDSLVGRIGFALGKDFKQGNAYVRASYLYDFEGETDISFTKGNVTRGFEQDLGGGWFEVGVGTNINLSDATHLYMDIEKTYGGDIATPWQWNVGVRYSF